MEFNLFITKLTLLILIWNLVRRDAVQCLLSLCRKVVHNTIPFSKIFPYKESVELALLESVDDPTRAVRTVSAVCRNYWYELSLK
jgi:hypothetical protein